MVNSSEVVDYQYESYSDDGDKLIVQITIQAFAVVPDIKVDLSALKRAASEAADKIFDEGFNYE